MSKPRILVMTAAGRTGLPIALHLLDEGFPVTALVRKEDHRSARLKAKGATIVAGSVTDVNDMRRAMAEARRAYFCAPIDEGNLTAAAVFATVAAEQKLASVVAMSQWLASPTHPAAHTRETWLADRLLALLPDTDVTTINVGFFADNDMQTLAYAAQFGRLMLPYGSGRNAPPSNEDIAAVVAAILARPEGHAGKTYRPTGPTLLSREDMATILATVLGRTVRYVNAPLWMVRKIMNGMGFSAYVIAQMCEYDLEYQHNTFAVGAPTDVVRRITGREPEDFETIARRYVAALPEAKPRLATQLRLMAPMIAWMLRPLPRTLPRLSTAGSPDQQRVSFSLSANSPEWLRSHNPT
jgi:NAD(P)H dehydrogenase (quinone)